MLKCGRQDKKGYVFSGIFPISRIFPRCVIAGKNVLFA